MRLPFLVIALVGAAWVSPLCGQDVQIGGAESDSTAAALRAILDGGNYLLLERDTTIAADVVIDRDVVIVNARVALEGTIQGTVAVIGGDFFARPRSRVAGRILVLQGGAYPSALADTGEVVYLDPRIATEVEVRPTGYGISLIERIPQILRIPGLLGFAAPTYDRVDGLSVLWGAGLAFGGDTAVVSLLGTAAYRTERERLNGGLEIRFRPSPRSRLSLAASRSTRTNESWIRGAVLNSLSSFLARSDVRNYYESDEVVFTLGGLPPPPLLEGEGYIAPRLMVGISKARSLDEGSPWSLFEGGDPWRPNPPIDEGVVASAAVSALFGWRGTTSRFSGSGAVEWAPRDVGDFEFAALDATAFWSMLGPFNHPVELSGYLLYPLGSGQVPRQRWSMLGGPGTLPTFPTGALRGDHVLFLRASYLAELRRLQLPVVGPPSLRLEYAAGAAWTGRERPPLEQNVGAGVRLLFFIGMVHVDPAVSGFDPSFSFSAQLPSFGGGAIF